MSEFTDPHQAAAACFPQHMRWDARQQLILRNIDDAKVTAATCQICFALVPQVSPVACFAPQLEDLSTAESAHVAHHMVIAELLSERL